MAVCCSSRLKRLVAGHLLAPQAFREQWVELSPAFRRKQKRYEDSFQLETICPVIALCTWPELFSQCLWIHFIDNSGTQSALITGSSSVLFGDLIAAETWKQVARQHIYPWFERVHTSSNPFDALSRRNVSEDGDLCRLTFPWSLINDRLMHLRKLQT